MLLQLLVWSVIAYITVIFAGRIGTRYIIEPSVESPVKAVLFGLVAIAVLFLFVKVYDIGLPKSTTERDRLNQVYLAQLIQAQENPNMQIPSRPNLGPDLIMFIFGAVGIGMLVAFGIMEFQTGLLSALALMIITFFRRRLRPGAAALVPGVFTVGGTSESVREHPDGGLTGDPDISSPAADPQRFVY